MIDQAYRRVAPESIEPGEIVQAAEVRITVETVLKTANGITVKGPLATKPTSMTKSHTFERGDIAVVVADDDTLDELETVVVRGGISGRAVPGSWNVNEAGELIVRLPRPDNGEEKQDGSPIEWTVPLRDAVADSIIEGNPPAGESGRRPTPGDDDD